MPALKRISIYLLSGILIAVNCLLMVNLSFSTKANQEPQYMLYFEHQGTIMYKDMYQNVGVTGSI